MLARAKRPLSCRPPAWSGGSLASTTHEATILPALPGPKYEPVSPRLASKLEHSQSSGVIANIQYSPDGKRLIASNYPGGVIHIWDLASGQRTLTIESGEGHRSSMSHFNILPGWRTALVPRMSRGVFTKVERDGKSLNHVVYDDLVYLVDLTTGDRLRVFQDSPPRGLLTTSLFPNGTHFFTHEEVPGDFDTSRPRALSVWEVATGQHRQFAAGSASIGAYSRDGKRVTVNMPHT
jgi:WD40 repeat protein